MCVAYARSVCDSYVLVVDCHIGVLLLFKRRLLGCPTACKVVTVVHVDVVYCLLSIETRGQSNLTKSASRGGAFPG